MSVLLKCKRKDANYEKHLELYGCGWKGKIKDLVEKVDNENIKSKS